MNADESDADRSELPMGVQQLAGLKATPLANRPRV